MGTIINHKKHFYTRIPLGILVIVFMGVCPFVIGMIGGSIYEFTTGNTCHEGNCPWAALPWLCLISIPSAALLFVVFAIIIILDVIKLNK